MSRRRSELFNAAQKRALRELLHAARQLHAASAEKWQAAVKRQTQLALEDAHVRECNAADALERIAQCQHHNAWRMVQELERYMRGDA